MSEAVVAMGTTQRYWLWFVATQPYKVECVDTGCLKTLGTE